jgi:hypothetical protein
MPLQDTVIKDLDPQLVSCSFTRSGEDVIPLEESRVLHERSPRSEATRSPEPRFSDRKEVANCCLDPVRLTIGGLLCKQDRHGERRGSMHASLASDRGRPFSEWASQTASSLCFQLLTRQMAQQYSIRYGDCLFHSGRCRHEASERESGLACPSSSLGCPCWPSQVTVGCHKLFYPWTRSFEDLMRSPFGSSSHAHRITSTWCLRQVHCCGFSGEEVRESCPAGSFVITESLRQGLV